MKRWLIAATAAATLSGCGYNQFQSLDEQTKASWSEVLNQYQRRADLVPNIVATVKGEAQFEQDTLTKVIEARAKATSIQATPELVNNPEAFNKFQQAQGELSGALSRLMVVSEQYPQLQANQAFRPARHPGRYRKPHHRGTQQIHPIGTTVQRTGAPVPHQLDRYGHGVQAQGQFHRRKRSGHFHTP